MFAEISITLGSVHSNGCEREMIDWIALESGILIP